MNYIINRLREPSTWAGIAAIATVFGVPADAMTAVTQIGGGLAGLAAIFLRERT